MDDQPQTRLILILEPDSQQAQQIAVGFQGALAVTEIVVISELERALDYLRRHGEFMDAAPPDLILLNFESAQSQALLRQIKGDRDLGKIPVILLNRSENAELIFQSYADQGNCYILKPSNSQDLSAIGHKIASFWLGIATLPQH